MSSRQSELETAYSKYLVYSPWFRGRAKEKYRLLQRLGPQSQPEPRLTVAVPVAMAEETAVLMQGIEVIQRAQQYWSQPVEVIVWANCPSELPMETLAAYREKFRDWSRGLSALASDQFQLQVALDHPPGRGMSAVRASFMEALIQHGLQQNYSFMHPVLWLDADTTYLSKQTLPKIVEAVERFDALFVHGDLKYTMDWASGQPLAETDSVTKAVVVNELWRRAHVRHDRLDGYPEESGLAFAIGTYLVAGGLKGAPPYGQSYSLLSNAITTLDGRMINDSSYTRICLPRKQLPDAIARRISTDRETIPLLAYVHAARLGTSARRHFRSVGKWGAMGLRSVDTVGYEAPYASQPSRHRSVVRPEELLSEYAEAGLRGSPEERAVVAARMKRIIYRAFAIPAGTKLSPAGGRPISRRGLG